MRSAALRKYPNLAQAPWRQLKLTVRQQGGKYTASEVERIIGNVVINMEQSIRNGVLSRWESAVVRYARQNIRLGNVGTGYELSGKLEATVEAEMGRGDRAVVGFGAGLPYGNALNAPHGATTTIRSSKGNLVFPNRKGLAFDRGRGKAYVPTHFAVPSVQYPGKAFFDDAVVRANAQLKKYIAEEVALVKPSYTGSAYWISPQGGIGWAMGRTKKSQVARERLIND